MIAVVIKFLLEDIGYNLTLIKIAFILIHRLIKYIVAVKLPAIIRLLLTFYKAFFLFSLLITIICTLLLYEYGLPILKVLLWLKAATLYLTFYFIRTYKEREFYYYRNLGIRDTVLWSLTLSFDSILFILFIILTYWLRR